MDPEIIKQYIADEFPGTTVATNLGDSFFIYDPTGDLPPKRQQPFATIVTGDHYDNVSALTAPGDYRLNIGLTKETYTSLLGPAPTKRDENGVLITDYDYKARNALIPNPFYAAQHWIAIIDPTAETFPTLRPLLAEAYDFAVRKHTNWLRRRPATA
ncbi:MULTISPECIES: DUF6194 family protein [unclassified Nocardia]|uniref:DUF6194 family protein n=1 Tax=unclassified Nocardia TaxID=2637762 RepID=UPI001CE3C180|nr:MULTISPECIES: DUF6194 family protein [unclassified Nocardia]